MKTNKLIILLSIAFMFSCTKEDMNVLSFNTEETTPNALNLEEAKILLNDFISESFTKSNDFEIKEHKIKTLHIDNNEYTNTLSSDAVPIYEFVTEMDGKEGYSVIVGDKRIEKVLVSVPYGSIEDTLYIEPLKMYFRDIPLMIKQDLKYYYQGKKDNGLQTKMTTETIYRFTSTTWGQGYPYNIKCPNYSVAGCVAIAVSQILAYHEVPSNLNWNSILSNSVITSTSDPTVIDQVGSLIYEVGVKLNTNYGIIESSAPSTYIPSTLSSYGLSCGGVIPFSIEDSKFSLQNAGPFIIGAQSASGGHMWICDGWRRHIYDNSTYYDYLNMNWGWNGSSNGFYLVEDPIQFNVNGYLYNSGFVMVSNIKK